MAIEHAVVRPGLALDNAGPRAGSGLAAGFCPALNRAWVAVAVGVATVLLVLVLGVFLFGAQIPVSGAVITGLVLGFSIAAPIGPMGVLCIQRTLLLGQRAGLVTGLGAATVEALYAGVAALGLDGLADVLATHRIGLLVLSAAIFAGLGAQSLLARPCLESGAGRRQALWAVYASTVAVALPSPMTLLPYAALCVTWAATGLSGPPLSTTSLVAGVFIGSMLWWVLLSTGVDRLRGRLLPHGLPWINRVSGVLIVAMGGRVLLLALGA